MIDQHRHCPVCGKPIPLSETVCSPECAQIIAENQKKVQRNRRIIIILFALIIIAYVYFTLIRT